MIGQGSPFSILRVNSVIRVGCVLAVAVLLGLRAQQGTGQTGPLTPVTDATNKDSIRLRITWGGGEPRQWSGSVSVSKGVFSGAQPLGLTSDAAGSVVLANSQLNINHWTPTNYGGVDVSLSVARDAVLKIDLSSVEEPEQHVIEEVEVAEYLGRAFERELGSTGNRIVIARAPGDQLPVSFQREHLVFSPGEVFEIGVRANRTAIVSQTANCRLRLNSNHGGSVGLASRLAAPGWNKSLTFELDQQGSTEEQRVAIPIPTEEGIYQLEIEVALPWQQVALKNKSAIRRQVQFVVLAREPIPATNNPGWKLFSNIESTRGLPEVPTALPLTPLTPISKLTAAPKSAWPGNELRRKVTIEQQAMLELLPGGWQAIPIPIDQLGRPHLIEIEFLSNQPAAIGFSLLEPDANGQIPNYGVDSGVFVPRSLIDIQPMQAGPSRHWHRLVCWPQEKQPYLLIANRHAKQSATIGNIKILSGPNRLPVAQKTSSKLAAQDVGELDRPRNFMAFYESPLFAENFGARETVDPLVGQPLDDWQMFYDGADRFVQYLKANSYSGAFVTVAGDGSAIYPSQHLGVSPKLDTGIFFSNGQDPIRKDVLELLFRMFEREGLTLVPTLALSGPLPKLEAQSMEAGNTSNRFGLVHYNQSTAPRRLKNHLPIYNPLDPAVQENVSQVVGELSNRYRSYAAFGGLAIICRPDTYTLLPGQQWGYDQATVRQFWQTQNGGQSSMPSQWSDVQAILMNTQQTAWTNWRAQQMSAWYRAMLAQLRAQIPQGNLYLAPVDLYRNDELSAALAPSLHASTDFRSQLLQVGLELNQFAETDGLKLLRPQRIAPNQNSAMNRVETSLENNRQSDEAFLQANSVGDIYTHRTSWAHFAQLQEQSLFGAQLAPIMRLQTLTPAGSWNRQRFVNSLRVDDAQLLVDGGWLLSQGQENGLQELISVFRQLPGRRFQNVPLAESNLTVAHSTLPVIVRQSTVAGRTWFYVVNASPWATKVTIAVAEFAANSNIQFDSLSSLPMKVTREKGEWQIQFEMEPLSLAGGFSSQSCNLRDYQFQLPDNVADRLRKQIYVLQAKLTKATNVEPLPVIKNSDFESNGQPSLGGWEIGQQAAENIQVNLQSGSTGQVSLQMKNTGQEPVWVRSNLITSTGTGRISVSVWLRTDNPDQQPPLRLAIEGTLDDSNYYRFGSVGALSPDLQTNQISRQWQRFAVHFDDLPLERLTNLRIGFDLMGPGEVQLDNVEVYDRWFDERDAKAITQRLASCGPLLANPLMVESCRLLLEGYWLRFLDEQFEEQNEAVIAAPQTPIESPAGEADADSNSKSIFRRFRRAGGGRNMNLK